MSFFSEASLAMIPSGYKTSKVYSAVPTSGDGDLTFSRSNDTATRVGPNGYIEKVRTNLVTYSEEFNLWTASDATTTANAAANPLDGATTADKVIASATTAEHNIYFSRVSVIAEVTTSIYAKADGYNFLYLRNTSSSGGGVWFNLSTGEVATQQSGRVGTITSVGNGWYRCSVTWNQPTAGTNQYLIVGPAPADNTATYLGDGTSGVLLFGAQMEFGVMTDYIATTSAAVSVGPVANVPRLDYLNSSSPRLLLEPQRTNSFTYSEQFDNAAWSKVSATITANTTISPDGYQNADTFTTTGGGARISQSLSLGAGTYTASLYVKKLSGSGDMRFFGVVDGSGVTQSFTPTDTWQRFTGNFTASTGITEMQLRENGFTGTLAIYGFQLEAGAYATSYIPTLGAAVTRGADAASKTGISSLIGQTAGTIFVDFVWNGLQSPAAVDAAIFSIGVQEYGTSSIAIANYNGTMYARVANGVSVEATINFGSLVAGTRYKAALAYANNDVVFYVNGVSYGSDTSASIPATGDVNFQNAYPNAKSVNQALLFKTRLTNDSLAELTSL